MTSWLMMMVRVVMMMLLMLQLVVMSLLIVIISSISTSTISITPIHVGWRQSHARILYRCCSGTWTH